MQREFEDVFAKEAGVRRHFPSIRLDAVVPELERLDAARCQRCGGGALVGNEDRQEQRAYARPRISGSGRLIPSPSCDDNARKLAVRRSRMLVKSMRSSSAVRDAGHREVDLR